MKHILRFFIIIITLTLISFIVVQYAYLVAPITLKIRHETIQSKQIPQSFDQVKIFIYSDVNYLEHDNAQMLIKVNEAIKAENPDIIIFLGDLMSNDSNNIDALSKQEITSLLQDQTAPLGKFAIMGDYDLLSDDKKHVITNIYENSNYDLIDNDLRYLHNHEQPSIKLVGLENSINGQENIDHILELVDEQAFTILVCHTPDTVTNVLTNTNINLFLAGHSLGGQVNLPLLGTLMPKEQAKTYYKGQSKVNQLQIDVTNGVGVDQQNVRFLADAEVVVYTLKSLEK